MLYRSANARRSSDSKCKEEHLCFWSRPRNHRNPNATKMISFVHSFAVPNFILPQNRLRLRLGHLRFLHLIVPLDHVRISRWWLSAPFPIVLRTSANLLARDPILRLHTLPLRWLHKSTLLTRKLPPTGLAPTNGTITRRLRTSGVLRLPVGDVVVRHGPIGGGMRVRSSLVVLHPLIVIWVRVL
jgi:hypothetical protein